MKLSHFIDKTRLSVHYSYYLELLDPEHRYGHDLVRLKKEFNQSDAEGSFWDYASRLNNKKIAWLKDNGVSNEGISSEKDWYIVDDLDDRFRTPDLGYIEEGSYKFILDGENLYLALARELFQHTSFLQGKPVDCAGTLHFQNGELIAIDRASGHYKSKLEHLLPVLDYLKKTGLFPERLLVQTRLPIEGGMKIHSIAVTSDNYRRRIYPSKKFQSIFGLF